VIGVFCWRFPSPAFARREAIRRVPVANFPSQLFLGIFVLIRFGIAQVAYGGECGGARNSISAPAHSVTLEGSFRHAFFSARRLLAETWVSAGGGLAAQSKSGGGGWPENVADRFYRRGGAKGGLVLAGLLLLPGAFAGIIAGGKRRRRCSILLQAFAALILLSTVSVFVPLLGGRSFPFPPAGWARLRQRAAPVLFGGPPHILLGAWLMGNRDSKLLSWCLRQKLAEILRPLLTPAGLVFFAWPLAKLAARSLPLTQGGDRSARGGAG